MGAWVARLSLTFVNDFTTPLIILITTDNAYFRPFSFSLSSSAILAPRWTQSLVHRGYQIGPAVQSRRGYRGLAVSMMTIVIVGIAATGPE